MGNVFTLISTWLIPALIVIILICSVAKKVPAYEAFTDGAKEGFTIAIKIIPYLVAIMVAVAMLRASGFIDAIAVLLKTPLEYFKIPADTLPLMLTRSLSGSATLGIFSDIVDANGVSTYASRLAAVIVGSSETTFYVLAVYFGAVGIKKFRHAIWVGILADIIGIIAAIFVCRIFF